MIEPRKKPSAGFWITVALVAVLVGYPLSFGPACWITSRTNVGASAVSTAYRPATWGMSRSSRIADAVSWYSELGSAEAWKWHNTDRWTWDESKWLYRRDERLNTRGLFTD
jgi:hypothetical protein